VVRETRRPCKTGVQVRHKQTGRRSLSSFGAYLRDARPNELSFPIHSTTKKEGNVEWGKENGNQGNSEGEKTELIV